MKPRHAPRERAFSIPHHRPRRVPAGRGTFFALPPTMKIIGKPTREQLNEIARRRGNFERHVVDCDDCSYDDERERVKHCMAGEIMRVRYMAAMRGVVK